MDRKGLTSSGVSSGLPATFCRAAAASSCGALAAPIGREIEMAEGHQARQGKSGAFFVEPAPSSASVGSRAAQHPP